MAGAAVKSLQQRLDESKRSEKEKDATVARLKSHVRQLEESVQKALREAEEKDAKREREHKKLQDVSHDVVLQTSCSPLLNVRIYVGRQMMHHPH